MSVSVKTGSFKLDEVQEQITDTLFPMRTLRKCTTKEDLLKWALGNFKTFKEYRDAAQQMGIDLAPTDAEVEAFHMCMHDLDCDTPCHDEDLKDFSESQDSKPSG